MKIDKDMKFNTKGLSDVLPEEKVSGIKLDCGTRIYCDEAYYSEKDDYIIAEVKGVSVAIIPVGVNLTVIKQDEESM